MATATKPAKPGTGGETGPFFVDELDGRFWVRERLKRGVQNHGHVGSREVAEHYCREFFAKFPNGSKGQFAPKAKAAATAAA